MPNARRSRAKQNVQRPTAAAGEMPVCTSGKDASWIMELDRNGYACRLVWSPVAYNPAAYRKLGIPIPVEETCEPTHESCDANPDVEIPAPYEDHWMYGRFPMHDRSWPRVTRLCVSCADLFGHAGNDWNFIVEVRERAAALRQAA